MRPFVQWMNYLFPLIWLLGDSFAIDEMKIGFQGMHTVAPSPRMEQKFKLQSQDPVHGNDFIYHTFDPNSEFRHRHFKNFLAIQDPEILTPSRKK